MAPISFLPLPRGDSRRQDSLQGHKDGSSTLHSFIQKAFPELSHQPGTVWGSWGSLTSALLTLGARYS